MRVLPEIGFRINVNFRWATPSGFALMLAGLPLTVGGPSSWAKCMRLEIIEAKNDPQFPEPPGEWICKAQCSPPDRINTAAVTSSSPGSELFFCVSWIVLCRRHRTMHLDT